MNFLVNHLFTHRLVSWVMILLLAISPMQMAVAANISLDGHGDKCQMVQMQDKDSSMSTNCALEHGSQCLDHLGCAGTNFSVSGSSSTLSFFNLSSQRVSWALFDESIDSHYPQLLKRPPKA